MFSKIKKRVQLKKSTDPVVERFLKEYKKDLSEMAEENGELIGFINPIIVRKVWKI